MGEGGLVRYSFIALSLFLFAFSRSASAEPKNTDLSGQVVLTEEAVLLSQVDTVSLYLSSNKLQLAPRLNKDKVVEVETTVLDAGLIADPAKLTKFVTRISDTFVSVLKERLPVYAPALAEKFDLKKDIIFNVNTGAGRSPFGVIKGGTFKLAANVAAVSDDSPPVVPEISAEPAVPSAADGAGTVGKKGCGGCPARR